MGNVPIFLYCSFSKSCSAKDFFCILLYLHQKDAENSFGKNNQDKKEHTAEKDWQAFVIRNKVL